MADIEGDRRRRRQREILHFYTAVLIGEWVVALSRMIALRVDKIDRAQRVGSETDVHRYGHWRTLVSETLVAHHSFTMAPT